jgi:hypothetical protein
MNGGGAINGLRSGHEGRHYAVASVFHLAPAVLFQASSDYGIVCPDQFRAHAVAEAGGHFRRAHYIREHDRAVGAVFIL